MGNGQGILEDVDSSEWAGRVLQADIDRTLETHIREHV